MQLVAVLGSGPAARALARYRDKDERIWLQQVPAGPVAPAVRALPLLGFAGAIVFGDDARHEALGSVARSSLDAGELGSVDTVTVAGEATLGDHVGGRAVVEGLRSAGWDPRGSRIVAVGDAATLQAILRELAAAGAEDVTVVGVDTPAAERAVPSLPNGVTARGMAVRDPALPAVLERCDALLRASDLLPLDTARVGPHLTIVDLAPGLDGGWRKAGRAGGATNVSWADVEAHRVAASLRTVLGAEVDPGPLLELFLAS